MLPPNAYRERDHSVISGALRLSVQMYATNGMRFLSVKKTNLMRVVVVKKNMKERAVNFSSSDLRLL